MCACVRLCVSVCLSLSLSVCVCVCDNVFDHIYTTLASEAQNSPATHTHTHTQIHTHTHTHVAGRRGHCLAVQARSGGHKFSKVLHILAMYSKYKLSCWATDFREMFIVIFFIIITGPLTSEKFVRLWTSLAEGEGGGGGGRRRRRRRKVYQSQSDE